MTKGAALTAGLSPSRVLKDVMTTSSSLHVCKNQNTTLSSQPYPLLLISTVRRLQSTPPLLIYTVRRLQSTPLLLICTVRRLQSTPLLLICTVRRLQSTPLLLICTVRRLQSTPLLLICTVRRLQSTPLLLICTVRRLQSTPPPSEQAVRTPHRWELVSSQVLLVPSPHSTTCAGRKEMRSKSSQVPSQAHLPQHIIYCEYFSHTP